MNVREIPSLGWATASLNATDGTAAADLSLLGAHYRLCNGCKSRWFTLECAIETVHSFIAPRFMTTLVMVATVTGIAALVL